VDDPFVELGPLRRSNGGSKVRFREFVGKMQGDGGGLEQDQVAIDQDRDASARIELEILVAFLGILPPIDEAQLELGADLPQHHMRQQAGIARVVVE
jgi:hypothetical protein